MFWNLDDIYKDWLINSVGGARMELNAHSPAVSLALSSSILNLHGWTVTALTETPYAYTVEAEYESSPCCPKCGATAYQKFGTRDQEYHDLPVHMKRVAIMVHRQRYRCKVCECAYMVPVPHMNENHFMTDRLVKYLRRQSVRSPTFAALGRLVGVSADTVEKVFDEAVAELDKQHVIETPVWLGIDEKKLGGDWRCVFTDIQKRKPIELLPHRDKEAISKFILSLDRSKIVGVVMDMYPEYRSVAEELLPNAIIVVDKFHIVRMANGCLERVRKAAGGEMPGSYRKKLKHERKLLMKHGRDLDPMQKFRVDLWLLNYGPLGKAYAAKEAYVAIWGSETRELAEARYDEWFKKLDPEIRPAFQELTGATSRWREYIFNYFDHHYTNAYTESVNGVIKAIQQAGRGYAFSTSRAKMIYGLGTEREEEIIPPGWW
jgi:transposase